MKIADGRGVISRVAWVLLLMGSPVAFAQGGADAGAKPVGGQNLNDGQIAAVVLVADHAERNQARLAERKSTNQQIQGFAQHMISDHGKNEKAVARMDRTGNLTPKRSGLSQSLTDQTHRTTQKLERLSGARFDQAYIDSQIREHQSLLNALNSQLIPEARSPKVREMLTRTARAVSSHLEEAKRIQASLTS